jgi:hypothetical protein
MRDSWRFHRMPEGGFFQETTWRGVHMMEYLLIICCIAVLLSILEHILILWIKIVFWLITRVWL